MCAGGQGRVETDNIPARAPCTIDVHTEPSLTTSRFTATLLACGLAAIGACASASPVAPSTQLPHVQPQSTLVAVDGQFSALIEALFLGTGPMGRPDNPGCDSRMHRMRGWPRGSRIRVVAYATVDADRRAAVQHTIEQANAVLGSVVTTEYQTRDDAPEPFGSPAGEIAIFGTTQSRVPALCGIAAANCQVVSYHSGAYIASRVILGTPFTEASTAVVAHELGHAFGLCHVAPERAGLEQTLSVMGHASVSRWTAADLEAIRRVYAAGLSPGDQRQRFVAAGLID